MLVRCYSVYDRKTLAYHPPYYAPTDGSAVRSLSDAMQDPNTSFHRHPADYVLYYIGTFDDQSGQMMAQVPAQHVVDCITLVPPPSSSSPLLDLADQDGTIPFKAVR